MVWQKSKQANVADLMDIAHQARRALVSFDGFNHVWDGEALKKLASLIAEKEILEHDPKEDINV